METMCRLCHKESMDFYNGIRKLCKFCGMHLKDEGKEFCSKICRRKYLKKREGRGK